MGNTPVPVPSGATFGPAIQDGAIPVPAGATFGPAIQPASIPGAPNGLPGMPSAVPAGLVGPTTFGTGPGQTQDAGTDIESGIDKFGKDVAGAITNIPRSIYHSLPPVQLHDDIKQALPIINAYEQARSGGKGISDAISAANDQADKQNGVKQMILDRAAEFKKNPTQESVRGLLDVAALAASIYGGGEGAAAEGGEITGEAATAGETAANASAPAESATTAANAATHALNPETGAIAPVEVGPIESAAAKIAAKSDLPVGSTAPTTAEVQAPLQAGIRNVLSDAADEAGVSPASTQSIRDVTEQTGDAVYAKSKAAYQALDDASGGRWQRFDDSLKNISDKMDEVAGVDDEQFDKLMAKKVSIETAQKQMIDRLVQDGKVDPKLADQARSNYAQSQALYDLDSNIKASTTGRAGIGNTPEIVDPKKLSTRLNKLYDSGRLQQAVGEDRAVQMLQHADTAQVASRLPSTGQKALQELLSGSTKEGRVYGTNTNFADALDKFNKMAPEDRAAQFGQNSGAVRDFLKTQARNQFFRKLAGGTAGALGAGVAGKELGINKALLHLLM